MTHRGSLLDGVCGNGLYAERCSPTVESVECTCCAPRLRWLKPGRPVGTESRTSLVVLGVTTRVRGSTRSSDGPGVWPIPSHRLVEPIEPTCDELAPMTAEELQIRVTIQCSREDQPQRVDATLRVPAQAGSGEEKVHGGRPIARVVGGRHGSARQSRWTCAPISVAQAGRSPSGRARPIRGGRGCWGCSPHVIRPGRRFRPDPCGPNDCRRTARPNRGPA